MQISNIKNINNKGFTLTELVVVVSGLAILSSLAIPNVLNRIKLNRVEEVKALMNGYASDCLGKYRVYDGNNVAAYLEETSPYGLDNMRLSSLGYAIQKGSCNHVALAPSNNDDDLYALDFRITDGLVLKTATPSNNAAFLNSCRNWAGINCGLSAEQQAEFERLALLAKQKSACQNDYTSWLNEGGTGERTIGPHQEPDPCGKTVWAFEGRPVSSAEEVERQEIAKYGRQCLDWRTTTRGNPNYISPEIGETIPACRGINYWFHSGKEFTSKSDWIKEDNTVKSLACIDDRNNAKKNKTGQYTYGPSPGPDPCGVTVWLCQGIVYTSRTDYLTTSCGTPPPPPPPPPPPQRCNKPKSRTCKARPNHPSCKCR